MDSRNTKTYRVGVVALLTLGNFINAVDRASLSVAVPFIIKDFQIDTATMGVALSAFFWAYVAFNMPAGNLADRFGTKTVLGWSAAIWSVFSAITGMAQSVTQIVLARVGVGVGEAASIPCNAKVVASNFPPSERGLAIGTYLSGIRVGNAATPIMMAFLIQNWGWRTAFVVTGLGSLIWCVLWYFGFKDLSDQSAKESGTKEKIRIPWKLIVTNRTLLGLTVVKFTQDYLMWMFMTWVPGYLIMGRGFSVVTMGFYMSLSYAIAAVAQPGVGWLSDWLIKRGWDLSRSRKSVLVSLQIMASTIIITGYADNVGMAMFFLVMAISAESVCSAVTWTIISDIVPGKLVGSLGGLLNSIGAIGGIVAPILTGVIVKVTGSFQLALTIGGCAMLVAALFILFVVPKLRLLDSLDIKP
ncbi:MAG: MFS transporter [Negativicutes bacterium]|nr:MFS transporter [Negativicutes bacterium]